MDLILQPNGAIRLGDFLVSHLADSVWTEFRAGVAFVKYSGVRHIAGPLANFAKRGRIQLCVGVDFGGSTAEGLKALLDCAGAHGEIWVYHNEAGATFHPKLYFFKAKDGRADVAVGSGNLTEGGIYTNYEVATLLNLVPSSQDHRKLIAQFESTLDAWCDPSAGTAKQVDIALIEKLLDQGYIVTERQSARAQAAKASPAQTKPSARKPVFSARPVTKAPSAAKWPEPKPFREPSGAGQPPAAQPPQAAAATGFLMTLQQTDAGVGQVTAGTSRRSPEVFIPLAARDYAPDFWGWPSLFASDPTKPGKMDRPGVKMWLGTKVIEVNMMTWPDKHDFRLRSEALRSAGSIGDILRLEKTDAAIGFDYLAHVVPQGTMEHRHYLAFCVNKAKGKSNKLWGYY